MHDAKKYVVNESDVVRPDAFRAEILGVDPKVWDPELWEDALKISVLLDDFDPIRAYQLLMETHGLGYLLLLSEAELVALNLTTPRENIRFRALPELSSRYLVARSKLADASTRAGLAKEIAYRALESQQWDQVTAGVIAWDSQGRRVADRILAIGTAVDAGLDLRAALRIAVSSGATSLVLYVWQNVTCPRVTEKDRQYAGELRVMASALFLVVEDVLLIGTTDAVSLAVLDQWQ